MTIATANKINSTSPLTCFFGRTRLSVVTFPIPPVIP
jgi:hypothetical protein